MKYAYMFPCPGGRAFCCDAATKIAKYALSELAFPCPGGRAFCCDTSPMLMMLAQTACFHALVVGRSAVTSGPPKRPAPTGGSFHALVVGRSAVTLVRTPGHRQPTRFHALVVGRSAVTRRSRSERSARRFHALVVGRSAVTWTR